jgi:hypothetical protein
MRSSPAFPGCPSKGRPLLANAKHAGQYFRIRISFTLPQHGEVPERSNGEPLSLSRVGDRGFESLYPSKRLLAGRHCRLAGPGRPTGSRQLFADRTSCHNWWPNQFRLLLAGFAIHLMVQPFFEIRIRKYCPACFAFARRGRPLLGHPGNAGDDRIPFVGSRYSAKSRSRNLPSSRNSAAGPV